MKNLLLIASLLSINTWASTDSEFICKNRAKEIAIKAFDTCIAESKVEEINRLKQEYQQNLEKLKKEYDDELLKLGFKSQTQPTTSRTQTKSDKINAKQPKQVKISKSKETVKSLPEKKSKQEAKNLPTNELDRTQVESNQLEVNEPQIKLVPSKGNLMDMEEELSVLDSDSISQEIKDL